MDSQTVWLPTALYTALIRLQLDDFAAIECVNAFLGIRQSLRNIDGAIPSFIGI